MEQYEKEIQTREGRRVVVDFFMPEDAEGITALFHQVHGDGYPVKHYYEPEALRRSNKNGDCCSVVARNGTGQVVGVTHVIQSAPYEGVYESVAGLVLEEYRNCGISARLQWFLFHRWIPASPRVVGLFGEPVCFHTHIQKNWKQLGAVEMGLQPALMPAEAYGADPNKNRRVACTAAYYSVSARPHRVYLPPVYAEALRYLYSELPEERFFSLSKAPFSVHAATRRQLRVFDFASVVRVVVHEAGADLKDNMEGIERDAADKNVKLIQVWLKLGCPWVGAAVEALREKGYFLGGILPRWFNEDGLLMQKMFCPPDWDQIHLHTDRIKKILRMVREDCDRVAL